MNVIISQALATGLPVIATRHSGLPDQVHDGRNGFLVPEADYQALAEKIIEMIEHPERWPAMGHQGRDWVNQQFDAERLIDRQVEWYYQIVAGK